MKLEIPCTRANVQAALRHVSPSCDRDAWFRVLAAIKAGLGEDGRDLADQWSQEGDSYRATDFRDAWKSAKLGGKITIATLWHLALDGGWKPDSEAHQETEAERLARERRQKARAEQDAKAKAKREKAAAGKAAALWKAAAREVHSHPYLESKSVAPVPALREIPAERAAEILGYAPKSDGKPLAGRLLLAPVKVDGKLSTLEIIDEQGRKSAIAGGAKSGGYWAAQALPKGAGGGLTLVLGEGVATVLSCRDATQWAVAAALSAGNLPKVAKAFREQCPEARFLVLGDVGGGLKYAQQAAKAAGAALAVPEFTPEQVQAFEAVHGKAPTDFNDLHQLAGVGEVAAQLDKAWTGKAPGRAGAAVDDPGPDNLPLIRLVAGELPANAVQAEAALMKSGVPIYRRGASLVRPIVVEKPRISKTGAVPAGALLLEPVDESWAVYAITRAARLEKYDARSRDWVAIDCPAKLAKTVLARAGEWAFPVLAGVIEAPALRPDGTLVFKPGYDPETALYLHLPPSLKLTLRENPTHQDATEAVQVLNDAVAEFPFAEQVDHAVALAAVLTALIRRWLPTAPAFVFDAPTPGSGKTLLADVVGMVATGRRAVIMNQGTNDEETEKRLGSFLIQGHPVLNLDNVERPLTGELLCSLLTAPEVSVRILGESRSPLMPTNLTLLVTGNNVDVKADLSRRILLCRLDPRCERPDERRFDHDLYQWIPENRGRLLSAALTVLRAFHCAGRPDQGLSPYGSFEEWSAWVRAALVWVGFPDPCQTRTRLEGKDHVTGELGTVLATWHQELGSQKLTVRDVKGEAEKAGRSALKDALLDVAAARRNPGDIDTKRLSHWLRRHGGRVIGGLRFDKAGSLSDRDLWFVEQIK